MGWLVVGLVIGLVLGLALALFAAPAGRTQPNSEEKQSAFVNGWLRRHEGIPLSREMTRWRMSDVARDTLNAEMKAEVEKRNLAQVPPLLRSESPGASQKPANTL